MIYRPGKGAMWDPSVLWYDGTFYAFTMYNRDGDDGLAAQHGWVAVSPDGVHWEDGRITVEERERERGCRYFKCFVGRCGDRFIMDHGVWRPEGQDTLRFYESTNLREWKYLFSTHPDPRWYVPEGRWDHMYMLPKEDGNPEAGYWGYPVACAEEGEPRGVGMTESPDGREWEALPPAKVEWGDIPPKDLEWGGCERIGGKYYLIGGTGRYVSQGYSMYVFTADDARGPFTPDVEAYRLCGSSTQNISWLAAWCRGNGEILISNYASMPPDDRSPWMLPFRKAVIDHHGHLRMGWWEGNNQLKGPEIGRGTRSICLDSGQGAHKTAWLEQAFDLSQGVVVEGIIRAVPAGTGASAGFALSEGRNTTIEIRLGIGNPGEREACIGRNSKSGDFDAVDITGKGCATVTGIEERKEHAFRLLVRGEMFELYVDDLLFQTYAYEPDDGRIGLIAVDAAATFKEVRAWRMSL